MMRRARQVDGRSKQRPYTIRRARQVDGRSKQRAYTMRLRPATDD
jgi:hypothetical protein